MDEKPAIPSMDEKLAILTGLVGQLQYRVAKLEGYTDEDARKIARRLVTVTGASLLGETDKLGNINALLANKDMFDQSIDTMIESANRLYANLDSEI